MSEQLAQVLPLRKRCNTCKAEKPVTEFYRLGKGYQAKCKTCKDAYDNIHRPNNPVMVFEATCSICRETKPAKDFYKRRSSATGLQATCIDCDRSRRQKRAEEFRKK